MAKMLHVDVSTPERQVFSQEALELVLPGEEGSFGVWPGHMPLVANLKPGMMKIRAGGGEETIYALGGGYAEIAGSRVIVLADTAELADEIDLEAAEKERQRSIAQLRKGVTGADLEVAEISLKKALARLNTGTVLRRRKSGK